MVLIYEDLAAGKRGEYFHEKLIGEMAGDCNFNQNLRSFDVLAIPEILIGGSS
jgi:hypothetical protein